MIKKTLLLIVLILIFPTISLGKVLYRLDVSVDAENGKVEGLAVITADKPERITVDATGLEVKSVYLNGRKLPVKNRYRFNLTRKDSLTVSYSLQVKNGYGEDYIDGRFISLLGKWYPSVDRLAVYSLTAKVPEGFVMVSEYEEVKKKKEGSRLVYSFSFPYPLEHLHLIGSTQYEVKKDNIDGVQIEAYFFTNDTELADRYIGKAKEMIREYSSLIAPFPYKRFAVVENFFSTGYSMPTFTLIGHRLIRFPFILNQSLPHEIVHQWFGCSVYVDDSKGNWAEGLTTYLSDYRLSEDKVAYRKNSLLKYIAYSDRDFPLSQFRGKTDRRSEAIGYGKGMMVFYMLEDLIGKEKFYKTLSLFYDSFRFKKASWEDLKSVAQTVSQEELGWFFDQWIKRKGMPEVEISVKDHSIKDQRFRILLEVKQKEAYRLKLPVFIQTYLGVERKEVWIDGKKQEIELFAENEPLNLIIDRDYQLFRNLVWEEVNPVIYFTLAGKNPVIYTATDEIYSPIVDYFINGVVKNPDRFSYGDTYDRDIIVLGGNNPVLKRIFGRQFPTDRDYVEVFKNPFGDRNVITVFNLSSLMQARMVISRIKHYGKYSKLVFDGFRITDRQVKNYQNGILLAVRQKAEIVSADGIKEFDNIIQDGLEERVVYIGEQHTLFSNHAMQLNIIKALHKKYPKLAIGMEMFQRSKQPVLDAFIQGKISEKEFLKQSDYYRAWKYNYNLYRPIILYCRENRIPIIGLNADRELIRKVSDKGIESLSPQDYKKLPEDMDFSNVRYVEYLKKIFAEHKSAVKKKKRFINFLQSQIIWDETMAETVAEYLKKHPDRKMVVLAGGGHIRFRFGIPSRVERRIGERGLTVLMDDQLKKDIADYIVYTAHLTGENERKLGVYVEETEKGLKVVEVSEGSVAEKSGVKKGDIIVEFNGKQIKDLVDLKVELFFSQQENSMVVKRGKKRVKLKVEFDR